jgi:Domain of unknown function (DUF6456)
MAKRSKKSKSVSTPLPDLSTGADFGHAFVRRQGRLIATPRIAAADGVTLDEVADIDRPGTGMTTRVARRADPLLGILNIRSSSGPDRAWFLIAEKFRTDFTLATAKPTKLASYDRISISRSHADRGPTQLALAAIDRVRRAWKTIAGPERDMQLVKVLWLVLIGSRTLQQVDTIMGFRCKNRKSRRLLNAGLGRLAVHYGLDR